MEEYQGQQVKSRFIMDFIGCSCSDTDPPHILPPSPDFLFYVFVTHTHALKKIKTERFRAAVTSCLFNLQEPH